MTPQPSTFTPHPSPLTLTSLPSLVAGILFPVSRGISKAEDPAAAAVALRDAMNECRASWMAKKGAGGAGGAAAAASEESLEPYQKDFLDFAVSKEVLRFGSFTLKVQCIGNILGNRGAVSQRVSE